MMKKSRKLVVPGVVMWVAYAWLWLSFPPMNFFGWWKYFIPIVLMLVSMGLLVGYCTKIIVVNLLQDDSGGL